MDLLIVGAGEMGRWFGATALDALEDPKIAFADADPAVAEAAAGAVGGRPLDGDDEFDAVCLAVPISALEPAVDTHADRATEAVLDVTGTMGPAVEALREHAPDRERLSLHPLFAAANAPGTVAAVPDRTGPTTDRIRAALVATGNDVLETTPAAHDRAMETVQTKAHAAVLAFALAAEPVPQEFSTPVFEALTDVTATVTGNDPAVYAEIQDAFPGADDLARAARRLADADASEFEALYREAGVPMDGEFDDRTRASPDAGTTDPADDGTGSEGGRNP